MESCRRKSSLSSFPLTTAQTSGACCDCLLQPTVKAKAMATSGSKATERQTPFEWSIGRPTNRGFAKGRFKVGGSGGLFHAAGADARGANTDFLLHTRYDRADALQIRIPAPPPGIVRVADDVAIVRRFAAEFTLQCHCFSCLL